jgi:archaellum component FlaC
MIEVFKQDIKNSLKEIQENTVKQVEALKEETNKTLNEVQENTTKQVNKMVQELKMEIETIKKTQRKATLEMDNLGKRSGATYVSIANGIQEVEEILRHRRYHRKY